MRGQLQTLFVQNSDIEIRGAAGDPVVERAIAGTATTYDHYYPVMLQMPDSEKRIKGFEGLARSTFLKTCSDGAPVLCTLGHGGPTLGDTKSGTLALRNLDDRLEFELVGPPDVGAVRDAFKYLDRGLKRGASIGFYPLRDKGEWGEHRAEDGRLYPLYTVREAILDHIAIVDRPANDQAFTALRSSDGDSGLVLDCPPEVAEKWITESETRAADVTVEPEEDHSRAGLVADEDGVIRDRFTLEPVLDHSAADPLTWRAACLWLDLLDSTGETPVLP